MYKKTCLDSITIVFCFLFIIKSGFAQVPGFKVSDDLTNITGATDKVLLFGVKESKNKLFKKFQHKVYQTPEIIRYNYYTRDIGTKSKTMADLMANLYDNSTGTGTRLTDAQVEADLKKINALREEIRNMEAKKDSLYQIYARDYVNFKRFLAFSFGPRRSEAFFDILYDKGDERIISVLNNTGFNFGSESAALYSELASGHLKLFRVSLGALVASSSEENPEEEKQEEAYQRLATYGGNTVLNMEYPLIYLHSRDKQFNFLSRALARGSADFPQFGSTTEKVAGSAWYGIDFYGDAATSNHALRFFFNFNFYRIKGTDVFKENLGVGSTAFNYGQLIVGLVVSERIKISFVVNTVSSEEALRDATLIGGGQVLRQ